MNRLNAKCTLFEPAGRFRYKSGYLGDADMLFEEKKVEAMLDRVEKRIGKAKENVVGFVGSMIIR
ncbi:MAG TPA: hypothetical protein VN445_11880 [Rectinemataceae bacterium]|nr:hypothetical protein [Rectinemataceae bacterium]